MFNVPLPPVTVVTEPVSGTFEVLARVQVIWTPVPSGLLHDAVDVITLPGADVTGVLRGRRRRKRDGPDDDKG